MKAFLEVLKHNFFASCYKDPYSFETLETILYQCRPNTLPHEGSIPAAVRAYRHFIKHTPEPRDAYEKSLYLSNYFQYRNAARLSLDYEQVQGTVWELFYECLRKYDFLKNELSSVSSYDAYKGFVKKYFNLFLSIIYAHWNKCLYSYAESDLFSGTYLQICQDIYSQFNQHFIDSQTSISFVLKPDNAYTEFTDHFLPKLSTSDSIPYVEKILEKTIDLVPFAQKQYADQSLDKYLESSPAVLVLALYYHELKNDPKASFYSTKKGETALLVTTIRDRQKALATFSYQLIDDEINFLKDLIAAISSETLNLYLLDQFRNKYSKLLYQTGAETADVKKIFTLAHDNLFYNNAEIYEFIAVFISYEKLKKQNAPEVIDEYFDTIKDKVSHRNLLIFYKNSDATTRIKIKQFYLDYVIYRSFNKTIEVGKRVTNVFDRMLDIYGMDANRLISMLEAHFERVLLEGHDDNFNIDQELNNLVRYYPANLNEIHANGHRLSKDLLSYILAEHKSNSAKKYFSFEKGFCAIVVPENGDEPYIHIAYAEIGKGTNGVVYAAQKIFLQRSYPLKIDENRFPQEIIIKVDRQRSQTFAYERWRLKNAGYSSDINVAYSTELHGFTDCINMPRIPGNDLKSFERLPHNDDGSETATKTSREIWLIVYQCLQQIKTFYQSGFSHADIKAANIIETPDKNFRLIDFGSMLGALSSKNNELVISPFFAPPWFKEKLAKHISTYDRVENPRYSKCTFEYNLAFMLFTVGTLIMALKGWIQVTGNATPVKPSSSSTLDYEKYILDIMRFYSPTTHLQLDSDTEAKDLFEFAKTLMSNLQETPENYALPDLDKFISQCESTLKISPPPPPVTRIYVR